MILYFSIQKNKIQNFTNKNVKFGVIWANTINIGDDIQTLAAINLLKKNNIHKYVLINREKLSEYDGDPVVVVMNGWYMHDISKFPPSKKIIPIFISFHVQHDKVISNNIQYFKKHEPIGCRDLSTKKIFEKYGIKAYFTGCLTLCFDEYKHKGKGNYIVDLEGCNGGNLNKEEINLGINTNNFKYIKHDYFLDEEKKNKIEFRLKEAQKILNKYKKANLVLTSRLHVALPCRAFNTNVKFIHKNYYVDKRFSGLTQILNGGTNNIDNIKSNIDRKIINKLKDSINNKFSELINKYKK